ncbi:hypothetical protein GCM10018980_15580 [Streptomyces capoamus]|uniref:Uncharacterized protein n=1 Tax=Streptomyces capoamus TaxID=68183 RepID=A0A919C1P0_9ACTN|nr:hypothetical protein [Streptomyces capoamus]GGW13777.1 hypothetical protein GCM10010501_18960 [Streptomyces libani subsp. rufus]GHG40880.1 hypothetical protein GCM10018980_15580 [Streptomyces capoamus]
MADEITFWDFSRSQALSRYNGSRIDVREIAELCRVRGEAEAVDPHLPSADEMAGIHPLALKRPRRWEAAIAAMIYASSGQLALREEIIKARELLDRLPRPQRSALTVSRMLALVPTMIAGFRFSRQGETFNPEANRYLEGARFLSLLLEERPALDVEIGLCAHRAGVTDPVLPEHVSATGANRMVAFVASLLDNSRAGQRTVSVSQQTATDRAAGTVNSLVFLHYAHAGELEHFLRTLDRHADDMRAVLARYDAASATRFRFTPLDPFSEVVERDMAEVFGPDWTGAPTDPRWRRGSTLDSAVEDAKGKMARFMRNAPLDIDRLLRLHKDSESPSERGVSALHWFDRHQRQPLDVRARYDVAFHHRLALTTLEKDGVGIGMERGWDAYQWLAWSAAYGSARSAMPLLYARSSTEPESHVSLRSFNLRQFW